MPKPKKGERGYEEYRARANELKAIGRRKAKQAEKERLQTNEKARAKYQSDKSVDQQVVVPVNKRLQTTEKARAKYHSDKVVDHEIEVMMNSRNDGCSRVPAVT